MGQGTIYFVGPCTLTGTNNSQFQTNSRRARAGIGIKNTVNRLKLLYGEKYDLKYGMIEEEYHVSLKLPVREFVENNLPVRQ